MAHVLNWSGTFQLGGWAAAEMQRRVERITAGAYPASSRCWSAPETMRCATRLASVLVLPEPAPAMMRSGGASSSAAQPCSTARRCSVLSLARYAPQGRAGSAALGTEHPRPCRRVGTSIPL